MNKFNKFITIPLLNEFVYTVLFEADYAQKRTLMGKYLKASMTAKGANAFARNSTREEKEYTLSSLRPLRNQAR
jgi:hypothetical protein